MPTVGTSLVVCPIEVVHLALNAAKDLTFVWQIYAAVSFDNSAHV